MAPDPQCYFSVLGRTDNPWADMQNFIHDQMYPRFATGFTARCAVLLVLLCLVVLISFLYLFVTIRDTRRKGRKVWLARIVRRPAGRYFVVNQYLSYPLFSILLGAIWIAYTAYIYTMFGPSQGNPRSLFYWLSLGWMPFFALLATTTFSTTSSANLASRGRKPNTHRLGPWTSFAIFVVLLPVLLSLVLGLGIWTGLRWHVFASNWQRAFDYLGEQAAAYGGGALDEAAVQRASDLLMTRCVTAGAWHDAQLVQSIVYIVASVVLLL
ncbi:hypothetical protein JCM10207_008892, partial [Rhodosporidiobolus poonsookiae]